MLEALVVGRAPHEPLEDGLAVLGDRHAVRARGAPLLHGAHLDVHGLEPRDAQVVAAERSGVRMRGRGAGGPPEFRDAAFEVKDGGDNRVKLTLR